MFRALNDGLERHLLLTLRLLVESRRAGVHGFVELKLKETPTRLLCAQIPTIQVALDLVRECVQIIDVTVVL
jgi:hypothetical protein